MLRYATVSLALVGLFVAVPAARAEDIPEKYRGTIEKGLEWVAKQQYADGHWDANNNQNPTTMTSLGGMSLLMEGSTLRDGKYSTNLRKAVDWLVRRAQPNGLIGNPNNQIEAARYIYGHGYAMLFLASVYGEEEDGDRRKRLEDVLTKAVEFSGKAQTDRGGWGYVSSSDSGGFDEGSTTITQLQGLRACRNAGIVVPKSIIDNAHKYMEKATTERGSVIYSLAQGGHEGGPALAAAALAGSFSSGEYNSKRAKKYIQFCRTAIPIAATGRFGHDEYTHYYSRSAQAFEGCELL
jgi:hypothetical protein